MSTDFLKKNQVSCTFYLEVSRSYGVLAAIFSYNLPSKWIVCKKSHMFIELQHTEDFEGVWYWIIYSEQYTSKLQVWWC